MEVANPKYLKMNGDTSRSSMNLTASGSTDHTDDGDIHEIEMPEGSTQLTITSVLNYCKSKILNPYLRLLSFVGLRPLIAESHEPSICVNAINYCYIIQVVALLLIGYVLHYMACFRRERGFCYKVVQGPSFLFEREQKEIYEQICHGSLIFSFVVPSALHFSGYLYAALVLRRSDDDQLPILMERVFLSSTNLLNGYMLQKSLVRKLWAFIILSVIWMILSTFSVNFMMADGDIYFKWVESSQTRIRIILRVLLVASTLFHDIVQATIISNYCLEAQLLASYVQFLKEKLLQYPVQPLEWMREIEEFKKTLKYFNREISPSVCLLSMVNLSYSISGLLWLFKYDHIDNRTLPIVGVSALNVGLWFFISVVPFVQAARLSMSCDQLKETGQEVRIRPFAHQDTPIHELDSVLLYTTSLTINAKLFHIPITGTYLCSCAAIAIIAILVLGQIHYLNPK